MILFHCLPEKSNFIPLFETSSNISGSTSEGNLVIVSSSIPFWRVFAFLTFILMISTFRFSNSWFYLILFWSSSSSEIQTVSSNIVSKHYLIKKIQSVLRFFSATVLKHYFECSIKTFNLTLSLWMIRSSKNLLNLEFRTDFFYLNILEFYAIIWMELDRRNIFVKKLS